MLCCDVVSMFDLKGGPFGGSPVESFPGLDDVGEATDDFFHGSRLVWSMGHDDVDIVQLKTLERSIHTLEQMLSAQSHTIRGLARLKSVMR